MKHSLDDWLTMIGTPKNYDFAPAWIPGETYSFDFGNLETYRQANGPGTSQRVILCLPKDLSLPVPAVVVPFYIPEEMLGFDPKTGEVLEHFTEIAMMKDLAVRGFATISAEAYHMTYLPDSTLPPDAWQRWKDCGNALNRDHPEWSGMGKLMADTKLLVDAIAADPRVDAGHISMAGHSLGGKMAFYAGMTDPRIKAVMASDFGIGFEQTNWQDPWYWGKKLDALKQQGYSHSQLLSASNAKPFCLLAGCYDNDRSWDIMQEATGYEDHPERLKIINHATGHRPPDHVLAQGYDFLETYGK